MSTTATTSGWSSRVTSPREIPAEFSAFQALEIDRSTFPLVLFSPAYRTGRYEIAPKLLVVAGDHLICLESRRDGIGVANLDVERVDCVEWGAILVDGWIRLVGSGPGGRASMRVEHNTAGSSSGASACSGGSRRGSSACSFAPEGEEPLRALIGLAVEAIDGSSDPAPELTRSS